MWQSKQHHEDVNEKRLVKFATNDNFYLTKDSNLQPRPQQAEPYLQQTSSVLSRTLPSSAHICSVRPQ